MLCHNWKCPSLFHSHVKAHRKARSGKLGIFPSQWDPHKRHPDLRLGKSCSALLFDGKSASTGNVPSEQSQPRATAAVLLRSLVLRCFCYCLPRVSISGRANMCKYFIKIKKKKTHDVKAVPLWLIFQKLPRLLLLQMFAKWLAAKGA